MKYIKTKCNEFCAHIHILPVYHLSLPAYNSHHGSFGRGVQDRSIDCRCVPPSSDAPGLPLALLKLQRGLYTVRACHFRPVWLPLTDDEKMPIGISVIRLLHMTGS